MRTGLKRDDSIMSVRPVLTKTDFAKRYNENEFGNRSPTWDSVNDWYKERGEGILHVTDRRLYHLRNRIKGGSTYYNLECWRLYDWFNQVNWVHEPNWYVSEMAPTELTLIQGEVQRNELGLYLKYSDEPLTMREALAKRELTATNLSAKLILQKYLDNNSYEWLQYLLDTYDNHVIEFSTYSKCWGTVPRFNTVFWEVRLY